MGQPLDLSPLRDALAGLVARHDLVLLFGSAARDALRPTSDLDLLVVSEVPHDTLVGALAKLQPTLGRVVEVTSYLPREFQAALRRRDPLLRSILRGPTVCLHGSLPRTHRRSR